MQKVCAFGLSGGDHVGNRRIELVGKQVLDGGRECIDGGLILVETRGGALKGQLHICIYGEGRHRRSAKRERRLRRWQWQCRQGRGLRGW